MDMKLIDTLSELAKQYPDYKLQIRLGKRRIAEAAYVSVEDDAGAIELGDIDALQSDECEEVIYATADSWNPEDEAE